MIDKIFLAVDGSENAQRGFTLCCEFGGRSMT